MYNVSTLFKQYSSQKGRTIKVKVQVGATTYSNSQVIEIELDGGLLTGENFEVGTAISSSLSTSIKTTDVVDNAAEIIPSIMFSGTSGDSEWLPLGKFYIDTRSYENGVWTFSCFDRLIQAQDTYVSALTYPATMQAVMNELCTLLGVTQDASIVINPSYTITDNPQNYTIRDMLGYIASAHAASCRMNYDGKIAWIKFGAISNSTVLTSTNYTSAKKTNTPVTINKVDLNNQGTVTSQGSGSLENTLTIINPFMTATMLLDVYNTIKGFSYTPYTMNWLYWPYIELGDGEQITLRDTTTFTSLILNNKMSFKGGLNAVSSASSSSTQRSEFVFVGNIKQQMTVYDIEQANIMLLLAQKIDTDEVSANYAHIKDGVIDNAQIDYADVNNLATNIATIANEVVGNATIGVAQIAHVSVDALDSGTIDTTKITLAGANNRLTLNGNKIQVFANKADNSLFERLCIGDVNGDGTKYGMRIRGNDGTTLLFDESGQTKEGFTDGYGKLVDNSLDPAKIDIAKVITRINGDGTTTIKSSKIFMTTDSLDVTFAKLVDSVVNGTSYYESTTKIAQNATAIGLSATSLSQLLDASGESDFTALGATIAATASSITSKVTQTDINNSIAEVTPPVFTQSGTLPTFSEIVEGTFSGNTFTRDAVGGWNAGFRSVETFTNGQYIECTVTNISSFFMFGLNYGTNDASYTSIDYAFYKDGASLMVYSNGASKATIGTCIVGDKLRVIINDTQVSFYQNGACLYTSSIAPTLPLYMDCSVSTANAVVSNIVYGAFTPPSLRYQTNNALISASNASNYAASAQDTANTANTLATSKNRVFTVQPTTPYDAGDLWVSTTATGDTMVCTTARASGAYTASDWTKNSVTQRVATAETKITADAIVSTVSASVISSSQTITPIKYTDGNVAYSGTWTSEILAGDYSGGDKYSGTTNDYLQYTFVGTGVNVYTLKGTDMGIMTVYIDGVNKGNVDLYNSSLAYKFQAYTIPNLAYGTHVVKLLVSGTKNTSATAYFIAFDYLEVLNNIVVNTSNFGTTLKQSSTDFIYTFNQIASAKVIIDATGLTVLGGSIVADAIKGGTLTLGGSTVATQASILVKDTSDNPIINIDKNGLVAYTGKIMLVSSYIDPEQPWNGTSNTNTLNADKMTLTYASGYGTITSNLYDDSLVLDGAGGMNIPNFHVRLGWDSNTDGNGNNYSALNFNTGINFKNNANDSVIASLTKYGTFTGTGALVAGSAGAAQQLSIINAGDVIGSGKLIVGQGGDVGMSTIWRNGANDSYANGHLQLRNEGQGYETLGFHSAGVSAVSIYHGGPSAAIEIKDNGGNYASFKAGAIYGSSKSNVTETEHFGEVITYADESPNHVHNDRGIAELDNTGVCIISLDPIWLDTVNTKMCDYWVLLTAFEGTDVKIRELGPDYFTIVGTPNGRFMWRVEAERKGYERLRFNEGDVV